MFSSIVIYDMKLTGVGAMADTAEESAKREKHSEVMMPGR